MDALREAVAKHLAGCNTISSDEPTIEHQASTIKDPEGKIDTNKKAMSVLEERSKCIWPQQMVASNSNIFTRSHPSKQTSSQASTDSIPQNTTRNLTQAGAPKQAVIKGMPFGLIEGGPGAGKYFWRKSGRGGIDIKDYKERIAFAEVESASIKLRGGHHVF
jgi:hypothetical protein